MKKIFYIIIFSLFLSTSQAYVFSIDSNGKQIAWSSSLSSIAFYIHTNNRLNLSSSNIENVTSKSLNDWNEQMGVGLELFHGDGTRSNKQNDIFFSNNDLYFSGDGVIGVTLIAFDPSSGEIAETDIIINENFSISTDTQSTYYMGDILSHELGHSIGLSHSEVQRSTMFFKLTNGQDTLSDDDKAGARARSPSSVEYGSIEGKMVGKDKELGIFGTHLQAISLNTGKVSAAAISDTNGAFLLKGLDLSDEYFIFNSPLAIKEHLPAYYYAASNNFCLGNRSYVGSFYQTCLNSDEGYPKLVNFSSSMKRNVGNVSIRCSLDSPPRYLLSKGGGEFDLDASDVNGAGNSFVGFFSLSEIVNESEDNLKIDLSNFEIPVGSQGEEYYLELKVVTQPFYSQLKTDMTIKYPDYSTSTHPTSIDIDDDGNPKIDYTVRIPLNSGQSGDNIFEVKLKPYNFTDVQLNGVDLDNDGHYDIKTGYVNSTPYSIEDFFPEFSTFNEKRYFYLLASHIVKRDSSGNYGKYSSRKYLELDNSYCVDAPNSVSLNSLSSKTSENIEATEDVKKENALACGSVDISSGSNGGGGAAMAIVFGFLLSIFFIPKYEF